MEPKYWSEPIIMSLAHEWEKRRIFPWYVICYCIGIIIFFYCLKPVPYPVLTGFTAASGLCLYFYRDYLIFRLLSCAFLFFFIGFTASQFRLDSVKSPVLSHIQTKIFEGIIESVDREGDFARIILMPLSLEGLDSEHIPDRIRLRLRYKPELIPGMQISGKARLYPPSGPAIPHGYDFARDAYFKKIGATGRVLGDYQIKSPLSPSWHLWIITKVETARTVLTERIMSTIGGQEGAVGASLITGKRGHITAETSEILRAAGIYHVVSISGFHMVLVAGGLFWLVRMLLAASPYIALIYPVKKIAAGFAIIGSFVYCIFAGAEIATIRSFIMSSVMMGAILVNRPVLSVHNVALAAFTVLLLEPEALLGPSFQMSFSAVLALIALAEYIKIFHRKRVEPISHFRLFRAGRIVMDICILTLMTSLVAGLATAPFAAYHFQTLQGYGLIGNALTLPLISFIVMPCAFLGAFLYPFGWDMISWTVMGFAMEWVLVLSRWVAHLPGSVIMFPQFSETALFLLTFAVLLLTIPTLKKKKYAVIPACLGLYLAFSPIRFFIAMDRNGEGAVIRSDQGHLYLLGKAGSFQIEQWLRADGDKRLLTFQIMNRTEKRDFIRSLREGTQCDELACIAKSKGFTVSFIKNPVAFARDCEKADIIITRLYIPAFCKARYQFGASFFKKNGAALIYLDAGEQNRLQVETSGKSYNHIVFQ